MKLQMRPNMIASVVILTIVIAAFVASFDVLDTSGSSDPGPAAYPRFVLVMIAICAALLFFVHDDEDGEVQPRNLKVVFTLLGLLALYIFLLPITGYILATILFVLCALWLAGERRPLVLGLYSILFAIVIYLVFSNYLNIVLPSGFVEEMLP